MKKEGKFEGKWLKTPFYVHKLIIIGALGKEYFIAFPLFYRVDRYALYMVGGWRDRTIMV
jgi:hypothetical protein